MMRWDSPAIPVSHVVNQHAEEAAMLFGTRMFLLAAPHVKLSELRRHDDRMEAHIDALTVAGAHADSHLDALLENVSSGNVFAALVHAVQSRRLDRLSQLLELAHQHEPARAGAVAAFGWLEPQWLRSVVADLLSSSDPIRREVAVAAAAVHRVDPGLVSANRMQDQETRVRARALRTAGELGRCELVSRVTAAIFDDDPACRFWAAWSAVLLGDRGRALEALCNIARAKGLVQRRALRLALWALPTADGHALLRDMAQDPANMRLLIEGVGCVGDPSYVPWLMDRMTNPELARVSGESFSTITGADLVDLKLARSQPEADERATLEADPADTNVAVDLDEGLPWPDPAKVREWWQGQQARFAAGTRCFLGAAPSAAHCQLVLQSGYQRQRIAAAQRLCLLEPGTPLFEYRAPAWRQSRELAHAG